jgi:hypothetical protein
MNSNSNCAICDSPISEHNNSKEHVITEAIGGRLKVSGFICKSCNNTAGLTWDAKLASQLLPLCHIFGVVRKRGTTPALQVKTTTGENFTIKPDGNYVLNNPSYSEIKTSDGVKINLSARSIEEAEIMLKGVQRKYPEIEIEQVLKDAKVSSTYPTGMIHHSLNLGGEVSGRSIVKSALALAHYSGISLELCKDAIQYLRDIDAPACFGYYFATDIISNRPSEIPLHCVSVKANPDSGLILGYVEYFGVQRIVVCLGSGYSGDHVQATYSLDPRTGNELNLSVLLNFTQIDIDAIYRYEMIPDGSIESAYHAVIPAALEKKSDSKKDKVFTEAIQYAFENCGAMYGDILNEDQTKKLSELIMERLTPYIIQNLIRSANSPLP